MSLTKLLQDSYLLQFLSVTDPNDPTSHLCDVHLHGTVFCGNRIYCSFSSIWYGTSLVLHRSSTRIIPDFLAFSLIVYLVVRSNVTKIPIPSLLKTIVRDATCYFLVIFTSHFVFVMFLFFASVSTSS